MILIRFIILYKRPALNDCSLRSQCIGFVTVFPSSLYTDDDIDDDKDDERHKDENN